MFELRKFHFLIISRTLRSNMKKTGLQHICPMVGSNGTYMYHLGPISFRKQDIQIFSKLDILFEKLNL